MKTRKVISAILAGACAISALSFSATAVASDGKEVKSGGQTTFKVTASTVAPAISVSVPSSVAAVINPYGVSVKDSKGNTYGEGGVTSSEYTIRNFTTTSNIAVNVEASLTVPTEKTASDAKSTKETIKVVTDATTVGKIADPEDKTVTDKSLAAWVVASPAKELTGDIKAIDADGEDDITVDVTAAGVTSKTLFFTNVTVLKDTDGKNVEVTTKPGTGTLTILPAATAAKAGDSDGEGAEDAKYGVAKFAISGVVTDNSVGQWTSSDKITLNLVLSLDPTAEAATTA